MSDLKIRLDLDRSTKGTHVFKPQEKYRESAPVSALYIAKDAVPPGTKSVIVDFTFLTHKGEEGGES